MVSYRWLRARPALAHAHITSFALCLGVLLLMPSLLVAQVEDEAIEQDSVLQDLRFSALPGDAVQIVLTLSQAAPQPLSFTIDNPARITFDLPEVRNRLATRNHAVGIGVVRSVDVAQAQARTRVVINLTRLVPYATRIQDNQIYITLGGSVPTQSESAVTSGANRYLENIDFRRGTSGNTGRILVDLSDPSIPIDIRQEGNRIIVNFSSASLPESSARRLDVTDFATPVQSVDTSAQAAGARMIITMQGDYEYLAYQSNDQYAIEVKAVTPQKKEADQKAKFGYTGERLSLNFQNIEVRAVLQLIADFTGLNLVTSDTVQGSLTLRLKNVPWDQALDIILKTKGLDMRRAGNVILVAPTEEIAAREKLELEAQKQLQELAPLRSEFIQINYAKAADLADLLKSEENSLLTQGRGNVTIDERTNTLLVQDTAEQLAAIRQLVTTLDVAVRQVLIESRIVIANDDFNKELGVRFGATGIRNNNDDGVITTSGAIGATQPRIPTGRSDTQDSSTSQGTGTTSIVNDALDNLQNPNNGTPFPVGVPTADDRLNVNLPVISESPAGRIAFALLGADYLLDLEISALQAEGRGEVVSSPRVITANQKKAVIEQGVELPYQNATSSGATSVEFRKAVLSLEVTPQITPDDRVILDLLVKNDSVGERFLGVPSINTRQVTTQVLVDNGETVVLGGIYQQTRNDEVDRVPFFGELPGVGALFRNTLKVDRKQELLIFVTPKIVKDSLGLR